MDSDVIDSPLWYNAWLELVTDQPGKKRVGRDLTPTLTRIDGSNKGDVNNPEAGAKLIPTREDVLLFCRII